MERMQIKWIYKIEKDIWGDIDTTLPMTLIRRVTMMGRRVGGVSIAGPAENWGFGTIDLLTPKCF